VSVESYIKENVSELRGKVFVAPEIPEKKLNKAISAIANEVDPDYVVAVADTSLFGNTKEGCVFLGDSVHIRGMMEKLSIADSLSHMCGVLNHHLRINEPVSAG
jgi:hypothetical protein